MIEHFIKPLPNPRWFRSREGYHSPHTPSPAEVETFVDYGCNVSDASTVLVFPRGSACTGHVFDDSPEDNWWNLLFAHTTLLPLTVWQKYTFAFWRKRNREGVIALSLYVENYIFTAHGRLGDKIWLLMKRSWALCYLSYVSQLFYSLPVWNCWKVAMAFFWSRSYKSIR